MAERVCPHCGKYCGWWCHRRSVIDSPLRDSDRYPQPPYPDHSTACLYLHGPADSAGNVWLMAAESQLHADLTEAERDGQAEVGVRIVKMQTAESRRRLIEFLAIRRELWPLVRTAMRQADVDRSKEIESLLSSARRVRSEQVELSKRGIKALVRALLAA